MNNNYWEKHLSIDELLTTEIINYKVAEQALTSNCGTDLKFRVFGNAPSGYQIKNYGREKREETKLNGHKVSTSHLPFLYLSLFQ